MSGPSDNRGVNTRALEDLFGKADARKTEFNDTITVSLLEVYNEEIRDLLGDGRASEDKLEVKLGPYGNHVPGLISLPVNNIQDVLSLIATADRNRSSATTNMNEHSSRSHMILTATVISEYLPTGVVTRGKLNLVDLAGSERINKSGATGQALKEAQNINKSLSALGDVIAARAAKQAHVPFRNSTLTYLLQDSISQDSKTLMIVCVSPVLYNSEETFCSLNFAGRYHSHFVFSVRIFIAFTRYQRMLLLHLYPLRYVNRQHECSFYFVHRVRTVELGKASKTVTGGPGANNVPPLPTATSGSMKKK